MRMRHADGVTLISRDEARYFAAIVAASFQANGPIDLGQLPEELPLTEAIDLIAKGLGVWSDSVINVLERYKIW